MRIKSDNRPLYQQAETALMELLQGYAPGQQLPTEPTLAQSLGISRATLREALRNLEAQQIITRRQGVGTFYSGPRVVIDAGLETLASVDTLTLRQGLETSTVGLEVTGGVAGRFAQVLHLDPQAPVTVIARTKVAGGRPVAYLVDVLPQAVATPEEVCQSTMESVLDFLAERCGPAPSQAAADIVPLKATSELARRLQVPRSTVLLLLEETIYARDGVPIDHARSYCVPKYFQFHLQRRILG